MTTRSILLVLTMTPLAVAVGGCAAVPLAMVGTAIGLGATAVSTGASVYSLGKLNSAELATGDAVRLAAERAGEELGFVVVDGGWNEDETVYTYVWTDELGGEVRLLIAPRAARLTRVRVDVGLFGNEPTARLILLRIREQLRLAENPSSGVSTEAEVQDIS